YQHLADEIQEDQNSLQWNWVC
ncbi:hypothetical protein A2U01_0095209, partial [Trifolium medium]|nr:hypothetical protein [Trifolium medium]